MNIDNHKLTREKLIEEIKIFYNVVYNLIFYCMKHFLFIQKGQLAVDVSKLKRKKIADDLASGKPLHIGASGDVTGKEQTELMTQKGKLAIDVSKLKRKKIADDLASGKPLHIGASGDVTGKEQTELMTQKGKLAAQWYVLDPELYEAECQAMKHFFPQFELQRIDDSSSRWYNCLCWVGELAPGILQGQSWEVMAVYQPNHPTPCMGGSVCVYLLDPTMEQVDAALGFRPHHAINDGEGGRYLCTTRAEDMSNNRIIGDNAYTTTAVQTLTWAVKWLTALELVMTGDLDPNLFQKTDGI